MTNVNRWMAAVAMLAVSCGPAPGPSMDCQAYVACVAKLTGSSASLDSKYGQDGTCWEDQAESDKCNKQCKEALAAIGSDPGC